MDAMILSQCLEIEAKRPGLIAQASAFLISIVLRLKRSAAPMNGSHEITLKSFEQIENKRSPQSFRRNTY